MIVKNKKMEQMKELLETNQKINNTLEKISDTMLIISENLKESEKTNILIMNNIHSLNERMSSMENKLDRMVENNA